MPISQQGSSPCQHPLPPTHIHIGVIEMTRIGPSRLEKDVHQTLGVDAVMDMEYSVAEKQELGAWLSPESWEDLLEGGKGTTDTYPGKLRLATAATGKQNWLYGGGRYRQSQRPEQEFLGFSYPWEQEPAHRKRTKIIYC